MKQVFNVTTIISMAITLAGLLFFKYSTPYIWMAAALFIVCGLSKYQFDQAFYIKKVLFSSLIKEDSKIMQFRDSSIIIFIASIISAIILSFIISAFLLTSSMAVVVLVLLPCMLYFALKEKLFKFFSKNLNDDLGRFISYNLATFITGFMVLLVMVVAKWFDFRGLENETILNTSSMANFVILKIKHECIYIQHFVRTISMLELEIARASNITSDPVSSILYFYYLFPSLICALAIPMLCAGVYKLFVVYISKIILFKRGINH